MTQPRLSSGEEVAHVLSRLERWVLIPPRGSGESPVRWSVQAPGLRCGPVHQERTPNDLITKLLVVPAVEEQNK